MNIGEIVKKCRWSRGWTQEKLSEKSGVPRQTIGSVETNKCGTSVKVLIKLLNAMEYDLTVTDKRSDYEHRKQNIRIM